MVKRLSELDTLLDLHGEVLVQEGGYWIKMHFFEEVDKVLKELL